MDIDDLLHKNTNIPCLLKRLSKQGMLNLIQRIFLRRILIKTLNSLR